MTPTVSPRCNTRIDPISPTSPVRLGWPIHTKDTLWHACIDFLTYSDDHPSRQYIYAGLFPSRERSISGAQARIYADLPIIPSSFEIDTGIKWLNSVLKLVTYNNYVRSLYFFLHVRSCCSFLLFVLVVRSCYFCMFFSHTIIFIYA